MLCPRVRMSAGPDAGGSEKGRSADFREASNAAYPLSIVILVAGTPVHLPECLASLRAQTYPADRCEVIVVDNRSPEDPTGVVAEYYPAA